MNTSAKAQGTERRAKDQYTQHDHIGDDEVSELQLQPSFYDKVREQAERFASIRLGQFVIERADRALKLIEDTTKWSLPQEKNSDAVVLARPLPWIPFLMLIIVLRLARIWLSLGALMIGNRPVSPADMIAFIGARRRKLRAVRMHGLRVMRQRQQETSSPAANSLVQQLSQWFSRAMCWPGVQSECITNERNKEQQQKQQPKMNESFNKRTDHVEADQNLTFHEMLSKYVNENSEDDSDYVPKTNEEESTSSANSTSSDSDSHSSEAISDNEAKEHVNQENMRKKPTVENGVHNKKETHTEKVQEKVQEKTVETTSNGNNDKEQTEVAQRTNPTEEEQNLKAPNAPKLNTQLYNNTAAAANTDQPTQSKSHSTIKNDPVNHNNSENATNPDTDTDTDTDTQTDTDNSCTNSVCHMQLQQPAEPETSQTVNQSELTTNETTANTIKTNEAQSTVETLTPATSSEDVFYSPIGSPNDFNSAFGPQAMLKHVTINTVPTHSTPTREDEDTHSADSEPEETNRQSILLAHPAEEHESPPTTETSMPTKQNQQHQQQQHQRQFNHAHQRYRGRNRR